MEQSNENQTPITIDTTNIQDKASLETSVTNEIQIRLALSCYPEKGEDDALETFLTDEISARFRKIIREEPELLTEYKYNQEEALKKIKIKLLH